MHNIEKVNRKKQQTKSLKGKSEFRVTFEPFKASVEIPAGQSLLVAARKANLPLKTTCGGKGTCGDCLVQIKSGTYEKKASAALPDQLSSRGYTLSCQTKITENLTVQLPQFQEPSIKSVIDSKLLDKGRDNISGIYELNPSVKKIELALPSPSLDDNYSDLKRLERELKKKLDIIHLYCEYSVLKKLADAVREKQGNISVILGLFEKDATIMDVFPEAKEKRIYGIACDVGTSTVALNLVDLQSGKIVSTASSLNQQIKCGDDIISRINYSQKPGRLEELHELIILTVNNLIEKASETAAIADSDIYCGSFSGNTTMIHLLLNLEPRYIREEPYVPTFNQVPFILSRDLKLRMNNEARIHCSPAVGSYVGGDITAGLLCTPILRDPKKTSLFIDAGTNGELVVGNKEWLMTCACSAGPAFEGSGIKCGVPAVEGAIEKIIFKADGGLEYKAIKGCKPKGLCGSGLVDLLAELFIHGYIDRHGKFDEKKAKRKLVESNEGRGFLILEGKKSFWGKDLIITEKDISNLIRTKGAVFSASSLLLKNVGLRFDEIDSYYIAGGFGLHLNIENAIRIGLLPDLDRNRFHYLGNTSLLGAHLILLSNRNKNLVNDFFEKMTYIELNTEPNYMNEYTGAIFLPHTDMELFPSVKRIFEL